jgi:hypothetical protein
MLVPVVVPWLREFVSLLTPWVFGFDPRLVHVRFIVENVVLVQAFIQVLIIQQMLHTDLHLCVALTIRANGRSLGT